jgi:HD-GYP domain-containing protein (c-di-GMP phosphodiesterase class II)
VAAETTCRDRSWSRKGIDMELQIPREEILGVGTARPSTSKPPETAWEVLERFGATLQQCAQSREQIKLILESVCASLDADAVFWHPGTTSYPVEALGRVVLPPEWFRLLTARLLAEETSAPAHILRPNLAAERGLSPAPRSVALVRISRSHGSWLGAVSFGTRRVFTACDVKVMRLARRMLLTHRQQTQAQERLRDSLFGLVHCLTAAIDAKDPFTAGHSERVARIAVRLGKQMKLDATMLSDLYLGGLLHDIGKIGVRDGVLQKPGDLTEEERLHLQEHTLIGDRLVSAVEPLAHLRPGVRSHHERFDGKGYPDGLAGYNIPLLARVIALADACDAMMAARPYRTALAPSRIDGVLADGAGAQWDPLVVEHFLACRHELYPICQRGLGNSVIDAVDRVLERIPPFEEPSQENSPPQV